MAKTERPSTERLHFRVQADVEQRLRYAAEVEKETLTDFVLAAAEARADDVLARASIVPSEYFDKLFDALSEPAKPNEAMRKVARASRSFKQA
jgi:uncharacterized protein (DUF1778 family)